MAGALPAGMTGFNAVCAPLKPARARARGERKGWQFGKNRLNTLNLIVDTMNTVANFSLIEN